MILDGVDRKGLPELAEVREATGIERSGSRLGERGQKQGDQHDDNADHDEQFDERKTGSGMTGFLVQCVLHGLVVFGAVEARKLGGITCLEIPGPSTSSLSVWAPCPCR